MINEIRSSSSDHVVGEKMEDVILPGFRFHPTDEELVGFYLKRKIQLRPLPIELIKQLDIYKYDPWELPKLAGGGEKEWYFYCPRDRKYRNSTRPNRVTGAGFWKATGTDRPIYSSDGGTKCIGLKKSLVFYKGRAAKGVKTDWMMHEFRLPSLIDSASNNKRFMDKSFPPNDSWAICKIFKKANSGAQRSLSQSWVSPNLPNPSTTTTTTEQPPSIISSSTTLRTTPSSILQFCSDNNNNNNNNTNFDHNNNVMYQCCSSPTNYSSDLTSSYTKSTTCHVPNNQTSTIGSAFNLMYPVVPAAASNKYYSVIGHEDHYHIGLGLGDDHQENNNNNSYGLFPFGGTALPLLSNVVVDLAWKSSSCSTDDDCMSGYSYATAAASKCFYAPSLG